MISIDQYSDKYKKEWNNFNLNAKNGLFLFDRNYMEYHQSRFQDHSLLVFKKDNLIAIFPANISDNTLFSHAGLTFGGFIMDKNLRTNDMLAIFNELLQYAKDQQINRINYKTIPYIYHTIPSEEDRYALFMKGGRLIQRDLSSVINFNEQLQVTRLRMQKIRRAEKRGLLICEDNNYREFWDILEFNLREKHQKKPVHTLEEILYLKKRFPENIRLFSCYDDNQIVSGAIIYESRNVAHIQYNASSERGRQLSALDLTISHLITKVFTNKKYLNWGISTENQGRYFNRDLAFFKESFGARAIVHDLYEVNI
jgi:hypothetical protein